MCRRHYDNRTSLKTFDCRSILTRPVRSSISLTQLESFLCHRDYDSNVACGYMGLEMSQIQLNDLLNHSERI
jgi:hypothetical protein